MDWFTFSRKPIPGSRAAHRINDVRERAFRAEIELSEREQNNPVDSMAPAHSGVPFPPGNVAQPSVNPRPQQPPLPSRVRDFDEAFHVVNCAGSFFTAISNIGCGMGSFAHIGESCGHKKYIKRKCVSAGFGMGGVCGGLAGAISTFVLSYSSLKKDGEGPAWRAVNCITSLINVGAALASGAPAMYAYFNHDDPDVCGNGAANQAAFAGFWIGIIAAVAQVFQSFPHENRPLFSIANATNTGLSAVAAILAASPDLCATVHSVRHRGGGQGFVAICNCLGVAAGALGGLLSVVGAFAGFSENH